MLALPWSSWKEKRQSSFHRYCGLQIDYSVWSVLQEKVDKTRITDLDDLKHHNRITTEWNKLDHAIIAAAVRRHLLACASASGGHFEHCF